MDNKNLDIKKQILDKIKEYDRIIIGRHFRPDGDAVGSTMGLATILRESFPKKEIFVVNEDYSDYVAFLDDDKTVLSDDAYANALFIAVDTGTVDRLSNKKYPLAKELVKIDHHVDNAPYGDISWVEDWRSSACEMIVDLALTFKDELKVTKRAAECLFTGMATDSGRFRFASTSGETMRLAGFLIDFGLDLETIYSNLYLEDFDYFKFQAYIFGQMKITENGVAYVVVTREMQKEWNLTNEAASNVISLLNSIKGSIIWLAFIENPFDDEIRVRLRSRFVTINKLGEKYGGGGHENAAGATVHSHEELMQLVEDADSISKEYKANNTGWL
ncbi:MAG: bifunctional oligoribonuclease/PAP phosphatase NrnA [Lachnospiraceae bacterium]|nr:bifunctional oligoribonuclease/PAP phosphatase NrnA [Lachnospiraceae bacterium]